MVQSMAKDYPKLLDETLPKNPLHILSTYIMGKYKNERNKKSMSKDGLKELQKYGKNKRVVRNRERGSYPVRKKLKGNFSSFPFIFIHVKNLYSDCIN